MKGEWKLLHRMCQNLGQCSSCCSLQAVQESGPGVCLSLRHIWLMIYEGETKQRHRRNFCQKSRGRLGTTAALLPFPVQCPRSLSSNKLTLFADICISLSYLKMQNFTVVTSCCRKYSCSNKVANFPTLWIFPSVCLMQDT